MLRKILPPAEACAGGTHQAEAPDRPSLAEAMELPALSCLNDISPAVAASRPGGEEALGTAAMGRYRRLVILRPRTRMPATQPWSSADFAALLARVTPDLRALLADSVPRSRAAIVAALADRHPKDDVRRTLMRLAVTEQVVEKGGGHTLPAAEADQG